MIFHVMTLFPDMIRNGLCESIIGRALDNGVIGLDVVNIRDYTTDKHKRVDAYPYGGGAGLVMRPEPVYDCYADIINRIMSRRAEEDSEKTDYSGSCKKMPRVIYMTPQGRVFDQSVARELSLEDELIFLCGHYEGIDERVLDEIVTDNLSLGDFVMTGGELPAVVMIDTIARLIPGVLNNSESAEYDSFTDGLLEYPQYTRPDIWHDKEVPEVLLSGNHGRVDRWRRDQSLKRTYERRPELLEDESVKAHLSSRDRQMLSSLKNPEDEDSGKNA